MVFEDDEGNLWVEVATNGETNATSTFDVFDQQGRYMGPVRFPFQPKSYPRPIVRQGMLYAVTLNDLDVAFVVRAEIAKGGKK
jgi:hypothetical protein